MGGTVRNETGADPTPSLTCLRFQFEFRKYQQMMLHWIEGDSGNRKHHLVAPPGSGKTIVGLEVIGDSSALRWSLYPPRPSKTSGAPRWDVP